MTSLLVGFVLAALAGIAGWRWGALSKSGAVGATVIGGLVFGFGGLTWAAVLVAFFLSSSLLSFLASPAKAAVAEDHSARSRRNFTQTMANGGVAALLAIAVGIVTHDSPWYPTLTLAYFGALSAAAADTWATEIGILSRQSPRLITTGEPVTPGRSGGVTLLGLLASLAGGAFIGASAFVLIQFASLLTTGEWFLQDWFLLPLCTIAGLVGSLVDSLLGATLQRQTFCDHCQTIAERAVHNCGAATRQIGGISWLDNDGVNFLATVSGAATAALISPLFLAP